MRPIRLWSYATYGLSVVERLHRKVRRRHGFQEEKAEAPYDRRLIPRCEAPGGGARVVGGGRRRHSGDMAGAARRRRGEGRGGRRDVAPARPCAWPGCARAGDYRAPKSRAALRDFQWFCLEHVRAWNAEWNYFDGLDAECIEAIRRRDSTWHRPSWPFGGRGTRAAAGFAEASAEPDAATDAAPEAAPEAPPASPERRRALASLGLGDDASHNQVKARYKTLAKRHHPDANGGCKRAEERLKRINEAYSYLSGGEGGR